MKKLTIIVSFLLITLFFIPTTYAFVDNPEYSKTRFDNFLEWELINVNDVNYLRSERFEILFNGYEIVVETEIATSVSSSGYFYVEEDGLHKSRVEIYNTEESTGRIKDFDIKYEDPEAPWAMYLYDGETDGLDATDYIGKYMEIVLILSPDIIGQFYSVIATNMIPNKTLPGLEFNGYKLTSIIDPTEPSELEQLPLTTGSIYNKPNQMGKVTSQHLGGNSYEFKIVYLTGTYTLNYTFAPETDMSMFDEEKEAFYFSDGDDKFIVFNDGDSSILTTKNLRETFIPFTIWNLNTNEIVAHHQFNVYTYIKEGDANNYYAYFYTDEFIIDRLISTTVSMEYRYVPIIGSKGDWIPYFKVLDDTTVSGPTVGWELKAAAYATTATTIGAFIPIIRWPALIIGTPLTIYLQGNAAQQLIDGKNLVSGSINQIARANPTPGLLSEIDGAYHRAYPNFTGMDLESYSLWRLHLGQFDKAFTKGVEINQEFSSIDDQKGLNIISMKYMTNGIVYTIAGDQMNHQFNPGEMDELPDGWKISTPIFGNGLSSNITTIIIGGVILLFAWQLLRKGAFTDMRKFLTFLIIAAIVAILLSIVGVISLPFFTTILRL